MIIENVAYFDRSC